MVAAPAAAAPAGAVRLGTRRSALATAQAGWVAELVRALTGREVVLVGITTAGDLDPGPLESIGGTGVFTSAVRAALLAGEVDLAVHSLKDLPTASVPGVHLVAVPTREDPRDALCCPAGYCLVELPRGSRVGTGSPRRAAQLRALGLGLEVVGLRGNVDTRLAAADSGQVDAVVLARAGLARLGRLDRVTEVLDPGQMLPAPGQGALALEVREGSWPELAALDDPDTRAATTAERALLATLEAGCTAPVGALADVADGELYLRAVVADEAGRTVLRRSLTAAAADPRGAGRRLAEELLAEGAGALTAPPARAAPPPAGRAAPASSAHDSAAGDHESRDQTMTTEKRS